MNILIVLEGRAFHSLIVVTMELFRDVFDGCLNFNKLVIMVA